MQRNKRHRKKTFTPSYRSCLLAKPWPSMWNYMENMDASFSWSSERKKTTRHTKYSRTFDRNECPISPGHNGSLRVGSFSHYETTHTVAQKKMWRRKIRAPFFVLATNWMKNSVEPRAVEGVEDRCSRSTSLFFPPLKLVDRAIYKCASLSINVLRKKATISIPKSNFYIDFLVQ